MIQKACDAATPLKLFRLRDNTSIAPILFDNLD